MRRLVDVKYKSGYMRMVIVDHRAKIIYRQLVLAVEGGTKKCTGSYTREQAKIS